MSGRREILSVDVESLIRKRSAYTFRSPHHYPVELVRDAARRGATSVTLYVSSARVEVIDDGAPYAAEALQGLATLLDPRAPSASRVAQMDQFEALRGLGLLAALAPRPSRLRIERAAATPGALEYRPDGPPTLESSSGGRNRVLIERRGRAGDERRVLRDWCRWARLRITLDGEDIAGHLPAPHLGLARLRDDEGDGEGDGDGVLWLPIRGEACRVRLLEHGIQWRLAAYAPDHGLLYEAAVESPEVPPRKLRSQLRSLALDLYVRAMEGRTSLPAPGRDRLDELVFLHHRRTDSRHLMGAYAPFCVAGTDRLIDLDAIRDRAAAGPVLALPLSANLDRYSIEEEEVLLLTPRQWEYLEEHAGVPLTPPPRRPRRRGLVGRLLGDLGRSLRAAAGALRSSGHAIPREDMTGAEAALVDGLEGALGAGRCYLPGLEGTRSVPVVLVRGGAWRPAAVIQVGRAPRVLLHRANRDVRRAARAVEGNEELLYLALPLLFNGHDGWI